ncbi:MAG: hypothetical protein KDA44_15395 [Planctomycetales bacterium]|nr:hypothetical protein [Planctomycetales bacterium]
MKKPRFMDQQIAFALKQADSGVPVEEVRYAAGRVSRRLAGCREPDAQILMAGPWVEYLLYARTNCPLRRPSAVKYSSSRLWENRMDIHVGGTASSPGRSVGRYSP